MPCSGCDLSGNSCSTVPGLSVEILVLNFSFSPFLKSCGRTQHSFQPQMFIKSNH